MNSVVRCNGWRRKICSLATNSRRLSRSWFRPGLSSKASRVAPLAAMRRPRTCSAWLTSWKLPSQNLVRRESLLEVSLRIPPTPRLRSSVCRYRAWRRLRRRSVSWTRKISKTRRLVHHFPLLPRNSGKSTPSPVSKRLVENSRECWAMIAHPNI